jgi:ParB family protein of integrating conjugative element (PFGI_1 class)
MTRHLSSIISTKTALISCFDIDIFRLNPRRTKNPLYEEIKASILRVGLQSPLHIVFHPHSQSWVLSQGGQTRLLICRELYETTGNEAFLYPPIIEKAFTSDLDLCINHWVENHLRGENSFLETSYAVMNVKRLMVEESNIEPTQDQLAEQMALRGMPIRRQSITAIFYSAEILAPNITNQYFLDSLSRKFCDSIRAVRKKLEPVVSPERFDSELIQYINDSTQIVTIASIKSHFSNLFTQRTPSHISRIPQAVERLSSAFGLSNHLIESDLISTGYTMTIPERLESTEQAKAFLILLGHSKVLDETISPDILVLMGLGGLNCDGDQTALASAIVNRLGLSASELLTLSAQIFSNEVIDLGSYLAQASQPKEHRKPTTTEPHGECL